MEGEFGAIDAETLSSFLRCVIAQIDTDYEQKEFVA